ncbi:hypothetical protein HK098_004603 [Nowakowskiella sp. JEL0407]|nr:hypothetical protein HK098_004603 [Nowakowskiella sp. JEL0407]
MAQPDTKDKKKVKLAEEDDFFEDFPAEPWDDEEETTVNSKDLQWEATWADDDESEDFQKQLEKESSKSGVAPMKM